MLEFKLKDRFGDPNGAILLIRRLLVEHAAAQWKRYAVAFGLMAIAAASTAAAAYLIGTVINQTYVEKISLALFSSALWPRSFSSPGAWRHTARS